MLQEDAVSGLETGFGTIPSPPSDPPIWFNVPLLCDGQVAKSKGHDPREELTPLTQKYFKLGGGGCWIQGLLYHCLMSALEDSVPPKH